MWQKYPHQITKQTEIPAYSEEMQVIIWQSAQTVIETKH